MNKIGIIAYLNDLARRYNNLAKASSDPKARFELEGLSLEISNKADGLVKAFTIIDRGNRTSNQHMER